MYKYLKIIFFFEFHPVQETNKINNQIFSSKNGINKQWFSYHKEELALYCSQCLSFSSSNSIFVKGMKDVLHIFIRVSSHRESVASYITWRYINIFVNKILWKRILHQKTGIPYRGKTSKAAYILSDNVAKHGNFPEIVLFLDKYNKELNKNLQDCIRNSRIT